MESQLWRQRRPGELVGLHINTRIGSKNLFIQLQKNSSINESQLLIHLALENEYDRAKTGKTTQQEPSRQPNEKESIKNT